MAKNNVYWQPYPKEKTIVVAVHPFSKGGEHQISFEAGDQLELLEMTSDKNWYRGVRSKTNECGIFPANFVTVLPQRDEVVSELQQILREWLVLLKDYYKQGKVHESSDLMDIMGSLLKYHGQLASANTTQEVKSSLKTLVLDKIEEGRRKLGQDVFLRTAAGELATEHNTPILALYEMHVAVMDNFKDKDKSESVTVRHKREMSVKGGQSPLLARRESHAQVHQAMESNRSAPGSPQMRPLPTGGPAKSPFQISQPLNTSQSQSSSPMQNNSPIQTFGLVTQPTTPAPGAPSPFGFGSSGSSTPLSLSSSGAIPSGPSPFEASPFEEFGASPFEDVGESPFQPLPTPGQSPFAPSNQPSGTSAPNLGLNLTSITAQPGPSGPTSPSRTSSSTALTVASPRSHAQTVSGARPQVTLSRGPSASVAQQRGPSPSVSLMSNTAASSGQEPTTPKTGRKGAISLVNKKVKESLVALQPDPNVQILLNFKTFACNIGEETELLFSIYNATKDLFISDEALIELTDKGTILYSNPKAFFRDISKADLASELYLVCKINRRGKLKLQDKKQQQTTVRRPYGLSVLRISERFVPGRDYEHNLQVMQPKSDDHFSNLHKFVIKNDRDKFTEVPNLPKALSFTLAMYREELETLLPKYPLITICNKQNLPEVIPCGYVRNDLYINLKSGNYASGPKVKSYEVRVQLRNSRGDAIQDSLFHGSADQATSEYRGVVHYKTNTPSYAEQIKIVLSPEQYGDAYLIFTIKTVTKKEGDKDAVGFIGVKKLMNDDGTAIQTGQHDIACLKMAKDFKIDSATIKAADDTCRGKKSSDIISIKTNLVSNRMTQNAIIAQLLNWRNNMGALATILNRFTFIANDPETVKVRKIENKFEEDMTRVKLHGIFELEFIEDCHELTSILDALFAVLELKAGNDQISFAVYNTIVALLDVLVNKMKQDSDKFKVVLDDYIENYFSSPNAYKQLMHCIKHYFGDLDNVKPNDLITTLKALGYLFKFIIASMKAKKDAEQPTSDGLNNSGSIPARIIKDAEFNKDVHDFFGFFIAMMRKTDVQWLGSQAVALQYFWSLTQTLRPVISNEELIKMIENLLDNITYSQKNHHLNIEKLNLMQIIIADSLFLERKGGALLPTIVRHLTMHLSSTLSDEVSKCSYIISNLLDCFDGWKLPVSPLLNLVPPMVTALTQMEDLKKVPVLILCLMTAFHLMKANDFTKLILGKAQGELRMEFLTGLYELLQKMMTTDAFPEHWFSVIMFYYSTILKVVEETCLPLIALLLGGEQDLMAQLNKYQLEEIVAEQHQMIEQQFNANPQIRSQPLPPGPGMQGPPPGMMGPGPNGPGPMMMGPPPGMMGPGPNGPGPFMQGPPPGMMGPGPNGPFPPGMGPKGPFPPGMGPKGPFPPGMGPKGPLPPGMKMPPKGFPPGMQGPPKMMPKMMPPGQMPPGMVPTGNQAMPPQGPGMANPGPGMPPQGQPGVDQVQGGPVKFSPMQQQIQMDKANVQQSYMQFQAQQRPNQMHQRSLAMAKNAFLTNLKAKSPMPNQAPRPMPTSPKLAPQAVSPTNSPALSPQTSSDNLLNEKKTAVLRFRNSSGSISNAKRKRSSDGSLIENSLKAKWQSQEKLWEVSAKAKGEQLWLKFTRMLITFIRSKVLAVETFVPSKLAIVNELYGDMRLGACNILRQLSEVLGKYQIGLVSNVIGPLIELMLMSQADIRQTGIDLYFQMIEEEFQQTNQLKEVEYQTIEHFDKLINKGLADKNFQNFFIQSLIELFDKKSSNAEMKTAGKQYVEDISNLMNRLLELKSMPQDSAYEDDKVSGIVNMMDYLKKTERYNLYTKYLHQLIQFHKSLENFVEAANAVLLHAKLLDWSLKPLPAEEVSKLPAALERDRKVGLYKSAITLFEKGKFWEEAIHVMDSLAAQYKNFDFDYIQLAELLKQEAQFYQNISTVERIYHEYFRVGFYGKGYGEYANVEFVYKGNMLERLDDFTNRIKRRFPQAETLTYTEPPPADILNSDKQYLQIFAVKPGSQEEFEGKERKLSDAMPLEAQKYVNVNNVDVFVYSRPFRKNKKKGETPAEEIADLYIKKTFYIAAKKLPYIQRRANIVETKEQILEPIDNSITGMSSKNKEIYEGIEKYDKAGINISPFTMLLKGVIDAAVNGGPALYKEVFLNPNFISQNPAKKAQIVQLKDLFVDQIEACETGLKVHERLCTEEMRGLHLQLEGTLSGFKKSFTEHISKLSL